VEVSEPSVLSGVPFAPFIIREVWDLLSLGRPPAPDRDFDRARRGRRRPTGAREEGTDALCAARARGKVLARVGLAGQARTSAALRRAFLSTLCNIVTIVRRIHGKLASVCAGLRRDVEVRAARAHG
jgi:hypothetical protein